MKVRGITIQEIKDNYYWRNRFDCGNSLSGTIIGTIFTLFGCAILLLVLWTQVHWAVAIVIMPPFTIYAIRERWVGLLWLARKRCEKHTGKWTDKPRVLLRSEIYQSSINGTKIGCSWGVDIDGNRYNRK